MTIFDVLTMVGGLCLFLFGMSVMGQALERRAGTGLRAVLARMTGGKLSGLLTGLGITAVIQSSSATTVMVVGFVNSGLMTLHQSIHVIMGANIGTTVTAWLLSLAGVDGSSVWVQLLKPSSFTPVLALIGLLLYMIGRGKKKDSGLIFLGFATLMFGMETMSGAVSGLAAVPEFRQMFLMFKSPLLGVAAGALLTAVIQSSSASVGILQALASTGAVSYGAAVPIVMGQNIGTCVTALLSSVGANRNARRAALVHLSFNVIGTAVCLTAFSLVRWLAAPVILDEAATLSGIAVAHSAFNILCTAMMLPMSGLLEKLVCRLIPGGDEQKAAPDTAPDERLLATPSLAIGRCRASVLDMARSAAEAMNEAMGCVTAFDPEAARRVREAEDRGDRQEDTLGTYLVRLSAEQMDREESEEAAVLLKTIGDLERISDHAAQLVGSAEELRDKKLSLSEEAQREFSVLTGAVSEVLRLTVESFAKNDTALAAEVEPLEQVVVEMKRELRTRHIRRMQQGRCSVEMGFIWSDMLTALERTSDHCFNIAGCVIDAAAHDLNVHETLQAAKHGGAGFDEAFARFAAQYPLPAEQG